MAAPAAADLAALVKVVVVLLAVFGVVSSIGVHYAPKYGVKVARDKNTNFARIKTYTWITGWSAMDKDVDRQVVAAVDRELAACGLTRVSGPPSDALVRYASLVRTDVDLKSKTSSNNQLHREYPVGTIIVVLLDPRTLRELFRTRVDVPLEQDPARRPSQVDGVVTEMFAKYPTRKGSLR